MTSKLIEAMARRLHPYWETTFTDLDREDVREEMRAVLAAMCEGEALEEMVERAAKALWISQGGSADGYNEHWRGVVSRHALPAILDALTVEP